MTEYSIDPGNHTLKFAAPGETAKAIASVSAHLPPTQPVNLDATSVLIEVLSGPAALVEQRWVIGPSAHDLLTAAATFTKAKTVLVPPLTLAAIEPGSGTRPEIAIDLPRLYVSHPQPDLVAAQLISLLQGEHRYYRTHGKARILINLTIDEIRVVPEGLVALRYALANQTVQWGQGLLAVIDLGGGTAIGSLWREGEQEVVQARTVLEKSGVIGLVNLIAADARMRVRTHGSYPKPHLLMRGMRDDTFTYGATGASYRDLFDEYRPGWWNSILERFQLAWGHWLEDIDHILVTGGGAALVGDAIARSEGWMRPCANPQFANVLGMLSPHSGSPKVKPMRVA